MVAATATPRLDLPIDVRLDMPMAATRWLTGVAVAGHRRVGLAGARQPYLRAPRSSSTATWPATAPAPSAPTRRAPGRQLRLQPRPGGPCAFDRCPGCDARWCAGLARPAGGVARGSTARGAAGTDDGKRTSWSTAGGEVFEANIGDVEDESPPRFSGPDASPRMMSLYRRLNPVGQAACRRHRGRCTCRPGARGAPNSGGRRGDRAGPRHRRRGAERAERFPCARCRR